MNPLYAELQWLPRVPQDFSGLLKVAGNSDDNLGCELRSLASFALDLNQLTKVAKVIDKARTDGRSLNPLIPFRLAVLSNSTIDMIVPALVASAARHGIALEVIQPAYDQVAQEALTPDSRVNSSKPDAVLFALDYRALPLKLSLGDHEASAATVQGALAYLQALRDGIKANSNAVCMFQTFMLLPSERSFGSLDRALPGTLRSLVDHINRELTEYVLGSGDVLFDIAGLAETIGLADWHDPRLWNLGKFSFSDELIPLYGDHVARTVAAIRGKSGKVLVLDTRLNPSVGRSDRRRWTGEGIKIAQGDAIGEAHLAVQRMALDLRQRGIVLAVSSKNSDEIARAPFKQHPEMLLKLEHIAVFQANWNDKASNIQAIAEELSVGLDSIVFLDDNPAERSLVRKLLPQVAVPELAGGPGLLRLLENRSCRGRAGYFESVSFAAEDLKRASFYQDNAKRASLQRQAGGVDAYLASLDMTITFQPFDCGRGVRASMPLINKSNQYNLTTRRYTDPEVAAAENDPGVFTLQVRLSDIFGDNGMISVVICRASQDGVWDIDTWLMSCRVLGRKVEHAVLREILEHARAAGICKLIGTYRPTERNQLVADHYGKLGFNKVREEESGLTEWELLVDRPTDVRECADEDHLAGLYDRRGDADIVRHDLRSDAGSPGEP